MKHILLLFVFCFATQLPAQSSLSERLALNEPLSSERINVSIYPNPATSHIGLSNSNGVERIIIFNMVGRQMKNFKVGEGDKRYYVGDLTRGMYLIQILGSNNEIITTKRISKR